MKAFRTCFLVALFAVSVALWSCATPNSPPTINSLTAEREAVLTSEICRLRCDAVDPDEDELTYVWSSTGGQVQGDGAAVLWTAPDSEGIYRVSVRVLDGSPDEAIAFVNIAARANHPPVVRQLMADAEWLVPSGSCELTCTAEDRDDHELEFDWSTEAGVVSGVGAVVTWTAPDLAGLYEIVVVVSDGHGGEDSRSLDMSVALQQPPVIESFTATPDEPKYWKEYPGGYRILKNKSCEITCVARDPNDDRLSYEWQAEGGQLSGAGPTVVWKAPARAGKYLVALTVSDGEQGAVASVLFKVESCASCVFN